MIKYIFNREIDRNKYDTAVKNALNTRVYACSWYLDAVADDWDVLVLEDYKAVMPLPRRKKYTLNYIYLLPWVQQLGIFSNEKISENLIKAFIKKIPGKYALVDYYFNSGNHFKSKYLTKRTNYILPLDSNLDIIIKSFNSNRRRILKKDFSNYTINKQGDREEFLGMYRQTEKNFTLSEDAVEKLQNLLNTKQDSVHIWNVYQENKLLAGLLFLKDQKRITYLLPVASAEAKKNNLPSFIVSELIKSYQNTGFILDFEGSMIEGVAGFYKSFGAEEEVYFHYKKIL
ncbi:MAG: hypothetical protein DSY82_00080 [Flavobacteriia bacterium]|nr:MAG: hypothetical protein DSY82_00080 [Flavobacteriia bacterium]